MLFSLRTIQLWRAVCLLVDLKMPEVSGIELLERLAQRRWRIPAVMLSGYGDVPAAVRAMQCGALDFLEKPYSLDSLRQSIVRAINLDARMRDDNANRDKVVRAMETLTAEERRVLELTADGKPDKAIAARLNLSTRTIQLRRASLMRRIGRQLADRIGPPPFALAGARRDVRPSFCDRQRKLGRVGLERLRNGTRKGARSRIPPGHSPNPHRYYVVPQTASCQLAGNRLAGPAHLSNNRAYPAMAAGQVRPVARVRRKRPTKMPLRCPSWFV